MGKASQGRKVQDNQAICIVKNIRVSPRKLNLVTQPIRGQKVQTALNTLSFLNKRVALDVKKALQSAIANAENNHRLDVDRLIVREAIVGVSLSMRRFHVRGRGKIAPVERPFANLRIVVEEVKETAPAKAKPAKKAKSAKGEQA
ncbi:MAG: 50S ribosomal protein L22 [Dongiaceae bacterium]